MKLTGIYISFLLVIASSTYSTAQEKDFCDRLHSVFSTLIRNAENNEVMEAKRYEAGDRYEYYASKNPLNVGGTGLYCKAIGGSVAVGYEERMSGYTTNDDAERIYNTYLSDLRNCFREKLNENVENPATSDIKRIVSYTVSDKYVMNMVLKEGEGGSVVLITVFAE